MKLILSSQLKARLETPLNWLSQKPYLLSGQPGHEIAFLNGTNMDAIHNYTKTMLVWSTVDGKIYQIGYTAQASEYSSYIQTVFYIIDSFRLL